MKSSPSTDTVLLRISSTQVPTLTRVRVKPGRAAWLRMEPMPETLTDWLDPIPPSTGNHPSRKARKYRASRLIQNTGVALSITPNGTATESKRDPRRHPATAPTVVPMRNEMTIEQPTSPSVQGRAVRMMLDTLVGKYSMDVPKCPVSVWPK